MYLTYCSIPSSWDGTQLSESVLHCVIYLIFTFCLCSAVLVIVIITGLTSPASHPDKWQTPYNASEIAGNGTQEEYLTLGAIGQYASNRNTIGVDKTGQIKTKWYAHYQNT